jgi:tetratricopeptide (TPR) repeat protein
MKQFRNILFAFLALALCFASCKPKAKNTSGSSDSALTDQIRKERLAHNKKVFAMASANHDNYSQLNALINIIADDSSNAGHYMDSAAIIYFKFGLSPAAERLAEKVLAKEADDEKMLEIKAQVLASKQKLEEALNIDRKLYDKTKKLKYLFNMMVVQRQMGNDKDAAETMTKIKTDPSYEKDSIDVPDEQTGRIQFVPAPAVMAYVEAGIAYSKKDINGMVTKLNQALSIYPHFNNARYDLQALEQQARQMQQNQRPPQNPQVPPGGKKP